MKMFTKKYCTHSLPVHNNYRWQHFQVFISESILLGNICRFICPTYILLWRWIIMELSS